MKSCATRDVWNVFRWFHHIFNCCWVKYIANMIISWLFQDIDITTTWTGKNYEVLKAWDSWKNISSGNMFINVPMCLIESHCKEICIVLIKAQVQEKIDVFLDMQALGIQIRSFCHAFYFLFNYWSITSIFPWAKIQMNCSAECKIGHKNAE